MRRCLVLAVTCLFFGFLPAVQADQRDTLPELPSNAELAGAFSQPEKFVIRSVHRIGLGDSREQAFLISVWLTDRGRNFSAGVLLHRPKLKQTKLLDYSNVESIPYLQGLRSDVAVLSRYSSGGGIEGFESFVVQVFGWKIKVLASTGQFGNNTGTGQCSVSTPCTHKTVIFQSIYGTDQLAEITVSGTDDGTEKPDTSIAMKLYDAKATTLSPRFPTKRPPR